MLSLYDVYFDVVIMRILSATPNLVASMALNERSKGSGETLLHLFNGPLTIAFNIVHIGLKVAFTDLKVSLLRHVGPCAVSGPYAAW